MAKRIALAAIPFGALLAIGLPLSCETAPPQRTLAPASRSDPVAVDRPVRLASPEHARDARWTFRASRLPKDTQATLLDHDFWIRGEPLGPCMPYFATWDDSVQQWFCRTRFPIDAVTDRPVRKGAKNKSKLQVFRAGQPLPERGIIDEVDEWLGMRYGIIIGAPFGTPPNPTGLTVDYPVDPGFREDFDFWDPSVDDLIGEVSIRETVLPSLRLPTAARVRYRLDLREATLLSFFYGVREEFWHECGAALFEVKLLAQADAEAATVWRESPSCTAGWQYAEIDLTNYRGVVEIEFGAVVAGTTSAAIGNPLVAPAASERTPIFILDIDTLRADHLGTYGYEKSTSPNIDALARDSVVFENAIAQSPWTLPSQMSILTGLYPERHGATSLDRGLAGSVDTLASRLGQAGYMTAAITDAGFVSSHFGFHRGFDYYSEWISSAPRGYVEGMFRRTRDLLANLKRDHLFLFLQTYQTHFPYSPPKDDWKRFDDGYTGDVLQRVRLDESAAGGVTAEERAHLIARYDGEIFYVDRHIGEFVEQLRRGDLYDRSIIVFLSDHGEEFAEHGGWFHGHALHEELLRVPMFIKFPSGTIEPRRFATPVATIDLMPTLLEFLGIPAPETLDGRSLLAAIQSGNLEPRPIYARSPAGFAVRAGDTKLISDPTGTRLIDLGAGPGESADIHARNAGLTEELRAWGLERRAGKPPANAEKEVELDAKTRQQLEALGYLD